MKAKLAVESRVFDTNNPGDRRSTFVPLADLFNHNYVSPSAAWDWLETDTMKGLIIVA